MQFHAHPCKILTQIICTYNYYLYLQSEQAHNNDKGEENAANSAKVCLNCRCFVKHIMIAYKQHIGQQISGSI